MKPPATARDTAQRFAQALARGEAQVACGLADDRFRAVVPGVPCAEALAELAADDRYVFTQPGCLGSPANYEEEQQDTADSVRVSIDCPEGYTWLGLTRAGSVWQVTDINTP